MIEKFLKDHKVWLGIVSSILLTSCLIWVCASFLNILSDVDKDTRDKDTNSAHHPKYIRAKFYVLRDDSTGLCYKVANINTDVYFSIGEIECP